MWAPKTPSTKSNSYCPTCFVLLRVSHLKRIPLKSRFTKLGPYKMEKVRKRWAKGNLSPSCHLWVMYRLPIREACSITSRTVLIFSPPSPQAHFSSLEMAGGEAPQMVRHLSSPSIMMWPFLRVASEQLCWKPTPSPHLRFCPYHSL